MMRWADRAELPTKAEEPEHEIGGLPTLRPSEIGRYRGPRERRARMYKVGREVDAALEDVHDAIVSWR